MRDDEIISTGYPFKCAIFHDNEEYVCYLSEHEKRQDVVSKFMESIMGDKFEPSEDYGVSIVHKGSKLGADVEIFQIFLQKFINNVLLYHSKKNDESYKSLLKSIKPSRETSRNITIADVEDEDDEKNTSCKQRLNFNLIKDHIASYVMTMISVKSTTPIELEKLCLLKPKITEIEDLFKMTEKDNRKLINLLFVSDK